MELYRALTRPSPEDFEILKKYVSDVENYDNVKKSLLIIRNNITAVKTAVERGARRRDIGR